MDRKTVEVTEVVDSAKFIGLPLGITCLTVLIMLVDGFDLQTMAQVAPALRKDWGLDQSALTPVLTGSMIGMAIGSVLLGWLGDRIGRRNSYIICIVFLFIGSLLSAYSTNTWELTSWRVLTGIGLGGVTPLAATLLSEWTPKHARYVALAFGIVAVPTGGFLGAGVAQDVIPRYGWRAIFYIGAFLPLFFILIALFLLPESPRYLAQRPKRHPQLARQLNRLLRTKRFDGTEQFIVDEPAAPPGNWFKTLLNKDYLATTLLLWLVFTFNTLCLYAYVNWLPTVLDSIGMPLHDSLQGSKLFNFGGMFGAIGGAVLIGYFGSKRVGTGLSAIGGVATLVIALTIISAGASANTQLLALICIAGMSLNGMQSFIYTVGAHSYPTYIRASGVGCAQTVSRIGGVLSSTVGGAYFLIKPTPPVSYFFYVVAACILVVVVGFYSLRVHIPGRSGGGGRAVPETLAKTPA